MKRLSSQHIFDVSKRTRESFGPVWKHNAEMNMNKGVTFKEIEGQWFDKEVIIVGASPSLEKQIHILKQIDRERFKIVCVDVVFKYLVSEEIIPDVVVVADSKNGRDMIYQENGKDVCDCSNIMLLAANVCNSNMVAYWKGSLCMYFVLDAENYWQKLVLHNDPRLQREINGQRLVRCKNGLTCGGNVGSICFTWAADITEAKRLLLMGMEHSWDSENKRFAGQKNVKPNKKLSGKRKKKLLKREMGVQLVYGYDQLQGVPKVVWTDDKYVFYAQWMDQMAEKANKNVVDLSLSGLIGRGYIQKGDAEQYLLQPFVASSYDLRAWYDLYTRKYKPDLQQVVRIARDKKGKFNMPEGMKIDGDVWDEEYQKERIEKWVKMIDHYHQNHPLVVNVSPKIVNEFDRKIISDGEVFGIQCEVGMMWDIEKMNNWVKERYLNVELSKTA